MTRPQTTALIVATALFMEQVDSTVIATALPTIAADIGTDPIRLKLALTAYLLSLATFIPISGWAADRFGARLIFRAAICVFILGSILCSVSTSLTEFVLSRVVQGAGGAMMVPVGRLLILRSARKSELLNAMAWLTVPALMGPLVGPPLGGFIATYFDWRWIFWLNVPVGMVGLALVTIFIDDIRADTPAPLDLRGFFLCAIGLSGLVFGLSVLGQNMLPLPITLTLITVGTMATGLYLLHARGKEHPLLDLKLMRLPTFFCAMVGGLFFRVGIGAVPFLLPLVLQLGLGMSAFQAGMLTLFGAVGALAMKVSAQPIVRQFGYKTTLVWNSLISATFLAIMALFAYDLPAVLVSSILLVGGFFRSLQFTALNTLAYSEVERPMMSAATSFYAVGQQVCLAMGVAVAAAVVELQRAARGDGQILAQDFVAAFLFVGICSALSVIYFLRLPPDAGEELTGRTQSPPRNPVAST
ncbi:MAG: MFS transporter [Pseudomonadota bacterium]